jgi:hypothetical protein
MKTHEKGVFMDYIVYIADECRKEARTHNYTDALEKQSRDVEQKQNIDNFEKFPTPFFVKKQFAEYKGRLIAAQEIVNIDNSDYAVIKFLAVLIKADKEYNDFEDSRTKVNGDRYLNRVNSEELREFVKEKIAKEPPSKKQSLSNEEESFLYSSNTTYNLENESLIYESESWIKTINSKQYVNYLSAIYDAVFEIVNGDNSDKHCIGIKNLPNHNIVFFYDREKKYVFLDGIYATGTEIEKSIYRWTKRKETSDIVRIARRSYPQYLIAEADLWLEIEKDPQSNFALSGEEIDVLKSINNQNPFPIFINGRAGSGKSTILQYLFAEYFSRYLSYQDAVPPPAYFTYNSELLKQAKKFVFSLLKTNSNFLENIQGKINDNDLNQKLDVSFNELRKYLLSIVDDENLFLQDKYINYSTFMKLWNNKFKADKTAQKEYPADISWHVIRTYIEGMKPKGYLEPEEYNGLEKDQKTVSFELYQKIYKTVWEWYRKLKEEQGHWDDQDLVRYIIEHDIVTSRFSGVFCDEAQDFTRIEMEVIYHLSIFSDRDIPIQYVPMIPFAFAGDELQTINPTGFRWDAITALFTEKFILSVYPDKSRIPPMNFSELKNNYRSTQNIVNFCNALQLFRADRFNIPNLLPQYTWENSGGPSVARFEPKNAIFWKGIKEKSDSVVFIIPCNEGDEIEWIRNDSELSANITIRDNKTPDILVLSANSAKGLEFAQVVVWKFGNQPGLEKLINRPATEDAAQLLPLQYHINKTYVAVSRTKNKLYLLDDDTGINYLWRVTQDSDLINSYLSRINKNPKKWSDGNLETYKEGSPLDFSDNIIDNHEETAKQLMENGLVSKQSYLLRQAARIFTNLKDTQRSSKCKGYAEIFDNSYFSSGNHFHDGGWIDLAIQAFLLANTIPTDKNGFNKIIELSELHATVTNTLPYYVALAVCDTTIESVNNLMDFLLNNNTSLPFDKYFPHEAMKEIISSALDKCLGQITNNKQGLDSLLGRVLKLYQQKTISIQPEIIAELAFSLSKYKIAIDYWNMSQKRDEKKYEDAQKQLKGFPDNITVLFSGGDYQNIVAEYRKYDGKISENDLMMVIQALFLTNLHDEAFNEVVNIHSAGQFEKIIHACSSSLSSKEKTILSVCQRIAVIFDEPWNRILKLIDSTKNENINPFYIAIALARTKGLPNQPSTIQKPITDFMEKEFTKKFDTIPDSLILVIGTAIEKAGRRVAALKYYEFAMKRFAGDTEKEQICAERWIHTKELQANAELNKEKKTISLDEAEKMRKKYGININEKIDDFIALDGKSTVIKYIIDTEMKKTPDEIKPSNVTIKIHHENDKNQIAKTDNGIKQKTEFDIEDYRLVYFTKARRINITSNANGKTISLYHFNKSNDCFSSQDYVVTDSFIDDIGGCKKIEETPIHFSITEEKITVFFEKSKVAVNFL